MEQTIGLASWGLRRLRRYSTYANKIVVKLPWEEDVLLVLDKSTHIRLRALLVELHMYRVTWEVGENPWELGGAMFRKNCDPDKELSEVQPPRMMHQEVTLKRPSQISVNPIEETPSDTYVL